MGEGVHDASSVLPPALVPLAAPASRVTRLTTVVDRAEIVEDVAFTAAAPANAVDTLIVDRGRRGDRHRSPAGNGALMALAIVLVRWRRSGSARSAADEARRDDRGAGAR